MSLGIDKAFNEGCDARMDARTQDTNPYTRVDCYMATAWSRGWQEAHLFWGINASWRVRPLPMLRH